MKIKYKKMFAAAFTGLLLSSSTLIAQSGCAISATTNLHGYGCNWGDQIDYFELDGIPASNSGCASNGYYEYFSAPVWSLQIGQTYTWTADVGSGFLDQGFAVWIDLDNDGTFTASEQLGNTNTYGLTHSGSFMVPFTAVAGGGHRMRLRCDYYIAMGNTNQTACETNGPPNYNFYYGETEDYDVFLLPAPPCSGTPAANSVVGPTTGICYGAGALLGLSTTYTVGGLTYQWQYSNSSGVGPWTNVGGSTMNYLAPSLTANTWFQVVVTCTNSNSSITATSSLVQIQTTIVDSIPYAEGFEGIAGNDALPNCSWTADNLGTEALTYTVSGYDNRVPHNGNNFASFYYFPGGTNSFYTNGIYLNAGVIYSASVWYTTNQWGDNNWEDLSILVGPNQGPTGQITVASTPGPAISSVYKSLSNTFSVSNTGVYYVAVRTTVNTNAYATYLSWDDLEIIAPCQLNPINANISTLTSTVCAGDPVTLNASGGHAYLWNTGANGSMLVTNPTHNEQFSVVVTNTMTGCSTTKTHYITVNPAPFVALVGDRQKVCQGSDVNLTAVGDASSFSWSIPGNGTYVNYVPQSTGSVAVIGTNDFGCSKSAALQITVNPLPNVTATASKSMACQGDVIALTGFGANSYRWYTSSAYVTTNPAQVPITSSITYSVIGTDANGCEGVNMVSVGMEICEGISEGSKISGLKLYPNPGTGIYNIELLAGEDMQVEVTDLVGRKVLTVSGHDLKTVDISALSNGLYYFNITAGSGSEVIRVVKF